MTQLYQACLGVGYLSGKIHLISAASQSTGLVLCEATTPTNHYKAGAPFNTICKKCVTKAQNEMRAAGILGPITAELIGVKEIL